MSSRSYLSIGDVLTHLRAEFPDVTISKIRFLESQGLVNPERTPSGYRKFYDQDVERLRWVLRQQREHFLPLKVIKDRLDNAPDGVPSDDLVVDGEATSARPDLVLVEDVESVAVAEHVTSEVLATGGLVVTDVSDVAVTEQVVRQREVAASGAAATLAGSDGHPGPVARVESPSMPPTVEVLTLVDDVEPARPAAPAVRPTPTAAASTKATPVERGSTQGSTTTGETPGWTAEELAEASGLDVTVVRELHEFGLIASVVRGGLPLYGTDALAVAKAASGFAQFGVEPRHLRLYKNAADREAGFIEQIVLPLVRQRNPQASAKAAESVDELSRLGQELRATLLTMALRSLLDL